MEVGLPFGGVLSPEVWGGFSVVGRRVGEIVVVPSLVTVPVMWDLFRFPYILWVAGAGTLVFPVPLELEEFEVFVFLWLFCLFVYLCVLLFFLLEFSEKLFFS